MSLRSLLFPLAILSAILIGLIYIQPTFVATKEKQVELAELQVELDDLEVKQNNISENVALIDGNPIDAETISEYFPSINDEDEIVQAMTDQGNRSNSTLIASEMEESKITRRFNLKEDGTETKSISALQRYIGTFDDLRKLIFAVEQTDRFHVVREFTIAKNPQEEAGNLLTAEVLVEYNYVPQQKVSSLDDDVYGSSQLNISVAQDIQERVGEGISDIVVPETGRFDPFNP